jgi:hypothetical protein
MRVSQRGRAILRQLPTDAVWDARDPAESVQTFRPGDFLLTSSSGGLARLLGYATASKINHAAVIIDSHGTVIEASPSLFRKDRAFRVSSVSHYRNAGRPCWIGYVEVREGSRQEVAGYAEHLWRGSRTVSISGRFWLVLHTLCSIAPRNYAARFRGTSALRHFFEQRSVIIREDLCYSSGELVARALERGGFIWEHDPAQVTPADIFRRYRQPEPMPVTASPRPTRIAHASLIGARTRSDQPRSSGSLAPAPRPVQNVAGVPNGAGDIARADNWQILLGIGVAAMVGLACVGFIEQITRLLGRKS